MNTPNTTKKSIKIVVEKKDGVLWGIVEGKGNFTPTPYGETIDELTKNFKQLITDYVKNEGSKDRYWSKFNLKDVSIEIAYNLEAFFTEFQDLKISSIAKRAGLNESLLRQYATGAKTASPDQVKKIKVAVNDLAKKMQEAELV